MYNTEGLVKHLPHGSFTKVSKKLGVSRATVTRVAKGETFNSKVMNELIRLADKSIELQKKLNSYYS